MARKPPVRLWLITADRWDDSQAGHIDITVTAAGLERVASLTTLVHEDLGVTSQVSPLRLIPVRDYRLADGYIQGSVIIANTRCAIDLVSVQQDGQGADVPLTWILRFRRTAAIQAINNLLGRIVQEEWGGQSVEIPRDKYILMEHRCEPTRVALRRKLRLDNYDLGALIKKAQQEPGYKDAYMTRLTPRSPAKIKHLVHQIFSRDTVTIPVPGLVPINPLEFVNHQKEIS